MVVRFWLRNRLSQVQVIKIKSELTNFMYENIGMGGVKRQKAL
jgi:hypothetical protein